MKFEHLLSPMKVGNRVYKNRIVSAPMAFSLIAQDPMAAEIAYRKLEELLINGHKSFSQVREISSRDVVIQYCTYSQQ